MSKQAPMNLIILFNASSFPAKVPLSVIVACTCRAEPLDVMLRSLVISMMGRNGDERVIAEAQKRFNSHVTTGESVDSNLKSAIFNLAMSNGDENTFDQLMEVRKNWKSLQVRTVKMGFRNIIGSFMMSS